MTAHDSGWKWWLPFSFPPDFHRLHWHQLAWRTHDVLSAMEGHSGASDEALLALAYGEGRVLVTEDKDFGELVFPRGLPHPCIVRLVGMRVAEKADAMRDPIEHRGAAMREGAIVVATASRVRIRSAVSGGSEDDGGSADP